MNGVAITLLVFMVIFFIIIIICLFFLSLDFNVETDEDIRQIELKSNKEDEKIKIFTLGTSMNRELYNNISSLKQFNYNYEVIGIGEEWGGWIWRTKKYINCIKEHRNKYGDNSIIIFIDGYDAFACSSPENLYEKFINYIKDYPECGIVSGLEKGVVGCKMYGDIDKWWIYHGLDKNKYKHKTCNAGFVMGYCKDLQNLYEWIYDQEYDDDQVGLREYTNTYPNKIFYDINSVIIYNKNISELNDQDIYDNPPHFRHYPGYGKHPKVFGKTFDKDVQKYIQDNYSIEVKPENELDNIKYVLIFSIIGFTLLTIGFIPQVI